MHLFFQIENSNIATLVLQSLTNSSLIHLVMQAAKLALTSSIGGKSRNWDFVFRTCVDNVIIVNVYTIKTGIHYIILYF